MTIISHEHTDTLKFILSDLNMSHNAHIKSIYYAALCSENIPIIKHLQQTFDDNIDILSAIENEEVSTDILDYLVEMKVKAVDVSKIIRLCAQLKQRTLNTEHNYDHLIDYVCEFIAPDAYIDLNYMAQLQTYQNNINDGLTYILKTLHKKTY